MNYRGYPILEPHYNIAPTSILPILTLDDGHRHISPMKWGLTLGAKRSVINLRAEAVPSRDPFRERHCGVITDGFYQWSGPAQSRQPYWFHRPDNALIVLAGLWQWQQMPDGFQHTFAIITTRANSVMAPIRSMLAPAREHWLVADQASTLVNNVKNDDVRLLAPHQTQELR